MCRTAAGACSLMAAIQQANAIPPDDAVKVEIHVKDGFSGTIVMPTASSNHMTTESPTGVDLSAYYKITRTITIDLDDRLHLRSAGDVPSAAAFWVEAPNVQLLNFTDVYSNESTIVFGANSDGSTLRGGSSIQTDNWNAERMVWVKAGADDITVADYTMGRFYQQEGSASIVVRKTALQSENEIRNLTISNVTIDNTPAATGATGCGSTTGRDCASSGIAVNGLAVNGFRIENSVFNYFPSSPTGTATALKRRAINAEGALTSMDWDFSGNTFTGVASGLLRSDATIQLPAERVLGGINHIRNNTFDNTVAAERPAPGASPLGQGAAIVYRGPYST
ncbi:MAG: hypothetical protein LBU05_01530, partial [Bifidobacteriaceae bacterium]|nr:hypothetical protein [Bifidobacteriaceae bacterium]